MHIQSKKNTWLMSERAKMGYYITTCFNLSNLVCSFLYHKNLFALKSSNNGTTIKLKFLINGLLSRRFFFPSLILGSYLDLEKEVASYSWSNKLSNHGIEISSLMGILFTTYLSSYLSHKLFFLSTIKARIAHGLVLSAINPLDIIFSTVLCSFFCSTSCR